MSQRRKREYFVAHEDELPDGARRIVTVRGVEIGVFNISGRYFALPNLCIHQWGPLCTGKIAGTLVAREENDWKLEWVKDGEILICPWHAMGVRHNHWPKPVPSEGKAPTLPSQGGRWRGTRHCLEFRSAGPRNSARQVSRQGSANHRRRLRNRPSNRTAVRRGRGQRRCR